MTMIDATAGAPANLAVVRGSVRGDATQRTLPSGSVSMQFDVTTTIRSAGRSTGVSVPVSWIDPPSSATAMLAGGGEVVVIGTVRRRFFRVGGATQSRTEVVADTVIPTRRRKQVAGALEELVERLRVP
jgi:single-strand DNA-binding protein